MNPNPNNPALAAIGAQMYGPRPGGPPSGMTGTIPGNGLAGFASTVDAEGIMVYNDRTNYSEWEFLLDPVKTRPPFNPLSGTSGTTGDKMNDKTRSTQGFGQQPGR